MGRRKRIYVDEMVLLAAIARETKTAIAQFMAEAKKLERKHNADRSAYWLWGEVCHYRDAAKRIKADGVEYDLLAFAGRDDLTPSQRIRHQQAIRRLSDRGYVELYGDRATRVKVLRAGWKALEAKPEPAIALTNLSDAAK